MEEGSVDSEGSEDPEASDDSDAWDSSEGEGSGWFADPDVEGQERYYDGSEWTPETRPADPDAPLNHLPEHTGELQRALAAATADIDDVEDRLGTLFDRAEQAGERHGRARRQAAAEAEAEAAERAAAGKALAESVDQYEAHPGAEEDPETDFGDFGSVGARGAVDDADDDDDDDDALADLDEALASEEPEKVKKSFFRRRS